MLLALLVMVCGFVISSSEPEGVPTVAAATVTPTTPDVLNSVMPDFSNDEEAFYRAQLWLARCIYSETKRSQEQELVAWVVRNRVETRYRGESTYSRVVMDPFQFSAFNRQSPYRAFLLSIDTTFTDPGWQRALEIAGKVIMAEPGSRPFPINTRHFYSERSLGDYEIPLWSIEQEPISLHPYKIDLRRFRFYAGVS